MDYKDGLIWSIDVYIVNYMYNQFTWKCSSNVQYLLLRLLQPNTFMYNTSDVNLTEVRSG